MATPRPRVTILYCTQCNWMLRAAWLAQELLKILALKIIGAVADCDCPKDM